MKRTSTVALLVIAFVAGTSPAADVEWRRDYAAARDEATKTGRPLLFVFETDSCVFCRKLDAVTLRDSKIVRILNDEFVPVKLDGRTERKLVNALKVEGYPTLVVATAAGKVVGRNDGFADAGEMISLLERVTAGESVPVAKGKADAVGDSSREERRKVQERIDADLDDLYVKIAAGLNK